MSAGERLVALLATAAAVAAILVENLPDSEASGMPLDAGAAGAVTVGVAVLLFVGAVPRAKAQAWHGNRPAETALVTSLVGFLSVASAWTGLPFVLGAGGAMLGTAARRNGSNPRQRGLGGFATLVGISAVVLGCVTVAVL